MGANQPPGPFNNSRALVQIGLASCEIHGLAAFAHLVSVLVFFDNIFDDATLKFPVNNISEFVVGKTVCIIKLFSQIFVPYLHIY